MKIFTIVVMSIIYGISSNISFANPPTLKPLAELAKGPSDGTARSLRKWRYQLGTHIVNLKKLDNFQPKYKEVQSIINTCYPTEKPKCLNDMEYYSHIKANPSEYRNANSSTKSVDDMLLKTAQDLPEEFHGPDGSVIIPDGIEELIEKKGWRSVFYKTKSTGGFDGSPNLYILAVPLGKGPNKWNQFAVLQTSPHYDSSEDRFNPKPVASNGNLANANGTLTIITYDGTKSPPEGTLRGLHRNNSAEKVSYYWSNQNKINSCSNCHSAPFRSISPVGHGTIHGAETKMSTQEQNKVNMMNQLLDKYSSWGTVEYANRKHRLGPPLHSQPYGWAPRNSKTRTQEYIKSCSDARRDFYYAGFQNYSAQIKKDPNAQINYNNIKRAMNCVDCHDNIRHGKLHKDYSFDEIKFKVGVHQNMPIGVNLNNDERLALMNCLKQEYRDVSEEWKRKGEWMLKSQCSNSTIQKKCSSSTQINNNSTNGSEVISE